MTDTNRCPVCHEPVDAFHWTTHGSRYTVDGQGFVRDISPLEPPLPPIGRLSQGEDDPPEEEDEAEDE